MSLYCANFKKSACTGCFFQRSWIKMYQFFLCKSCVISHPSHEEQSCCLPGSLSQLHSKIKSKCCSTLVCKTTEYGAFASIRLHALNRSTFVLSVCLKNKEFLRDLEKMIGQGNAGCIIISQRYSFETRSFRHVILTRFMQ